MASQVRRSLLIGGHLCCAVLRRLLQTCHRARPLLLSLCALLLAGVAQYTYLNALYLVDDLYEVTGPREPMLEERFTLRARSGGSMKTLKAFVER